MSAIDPKRTLMNAVYITKGYYNYGMDCFNVYNGRLRSNIATIFKQWFFYSDFRHTHRCIIGFFFRSDAIYKPEETGKPGHAAFLYPCPHLAIKYLYALKEQIVQHRYKECLECEDIIETSPQPELQIRHMSKYLWWRF